MPPTTVSHFELLEKLGDLKLNRIVSLKFLPLFRSRVPRWRYPASPPPSVPMVAASPYPPSSLGPSVWPKASNTPTAIS